MEENKDEVLNMSIDSASAEDFLKEELENEEKRQNEQEARDTADEARKKEGEKDLELKESEKGNERKAEKQEQTEEAAKNEKEQKEDDKKKDQMQKENTWEKKRKHKHWLKHKRKQSKMVRVIGNNEQKNEEKREKEQEIQPMKLLTYKKYKIMRDQQGGPQSKASYKWWLRNGGKDRPGFLESWRPKPYDRTQLDVFKNYRSDRPCGQMTFHNLINVNVNGEGSTGVRL